MNIKNPIERYKISKTIFFWDCSFTIKVRLSTSKKLPDFNESPLKVMKNMLFISPKKHFSLSRFLNFCFEFLVRYKKRLD